MKKILIYEFCHSNYLTEDGVDPIICKTLEELNIAVNREFKRKTEHDHAVITVVEAYEDKDTIRYIQEKRD